MDVVVRKKKEDTHLWVLCKVVESTMYEVQTRYNLLPTYKVMVRVMSEHDIITPSALCNIIIGESLIYAYKLIQ